MNDSQKRDLSIPMSKANVYGILIATPIAILQLAVFYYTYKSMVYEINLNLLPIFILIGLGIILHEVIHGLAWAIFARRSIHTIKFGFQWKTLTPYAHCDTPIQARAYRWGAFLPGLILGIIPYLLSITLASHPLFLFSLFHTAAASGDWLVVWSLRNVPSANLVEDHPTHAGCYILEPTP